MDNKALYKIGYGLYVLTAKANGKDNGCIINTAIQVTSSPCNISITVNKQNFTHDLIKISGKLNISVLTTETPFSLIKHFGFCSGRDTDKFSGIVAEESENGLKYIKESANAFISGKVFDSVDLGTHTMFFAEVIAAEILSDKPALTYDYYQTNIKPSANTNASKTKWRCEICGYEYDGDNLPPDYICPVCKHGASDFSKV